MTTWIGVIGDPWGMPILTGWRFSLSPSNARPICRSERKVSVHLMTSVDHGSNRGSSPRFLGTQYHTPLNYFKLPQQLGIRIFMPHQTDVYKKIALRRGEPPPVVRFLIRPIPVAWRAPTLEKCALLARCRSLRNANSSYCKSENGR